MRWTERNLTILSYLFSPLIIIFSITESFLDWRDRKLDELKREELSNV